MKRHTRLYRATVSITLLLLTLSVLFGCTRPDITGGHSVTTADTVIDSLFGTDGAGTMPAPDEEETGAETGTPLTSEDTTAPHEPPQDTQAPGTEPGTSEESSEPVDVTVHEAVGSPAGYRPAADRAEALERADCGEIAGYLYVPDQAPNLSPVRLMMGDKYIRNSAPYFADEDTYVVVDYAGREVFRVFRGGGYITLEEVAAYVYAFGDVPPNYNAGKKLSPTSSPWGEYLRLNHSKFTGNTSKYPYEPELPDISGCGGELTYYELDIGTQGTDCDPRYTARIYNDGSRITRGAARIVYARYDRNGDAIIDPTERYLFYTYNHYNDFREYLGYYGGWGEMFGNITGGGSISSKTDYNPTPYVPVVMAELCVDARTGYVTDILWYDFRRWDALRAA